MLGDQAVSGAADRPASRLFLRARDLLVAGVTWAIPIGFAVSLNHVVGVGCPMKASTGLDCPACGATRAIVSLMQGRFIDALHYNAALIAVGLPAVVFIAAYRLAGTEIIAVPDWLKRRKALGIVVVSIAWTVLRNLPALHGLNSSWQNT